MRTSMLEDVRAYITKHPDSGPEAVARALGCSEATARKHLAAIATADTIAQDRRVARVDSQQDESAAEVERLTERVLDLNELVVDLVFENTRLRRALADREG